MKTKEDLFGRLYMSMYKKNLEEIWNILEEYPKKCRKTFLKNIKKLSFEHITMEQLRKISEDIDVNGLYLPYENKIYLNEFKNEHEEINHELFHVSSCTPKYWGVIVDVTINNTTKTIGENLNEGITEYLALLSTNSKKQSTSAYQLEVFVIESLIRIYGKNILIPYFQNKPPKFYSQFQKDVHHIVQLDILLNNLSKRIDVRNTFEEYILLKDLDCDQLKNNNLYLQTNNMKELNKWLEKHQIKINELCEEVEQKYNDLTIYSIKEEENKEMYLNWYKMYTNYQKLIFEKIIKIIIVLARKHHITDEEIKTMLIENLKYKEETLDIIKYKNKKLIRK